MQDIHKEIGTKIRYFRNLLGISQEELAFKSGLNTTYIGQVERGDKNISVQSLNQIAIALDVSLSQLFNFDSDNNETNYKAEINIILNKMKDIHLHSLYHIVLNFYIALKKAKG